MNSLAAARSRHPDRREPRSWPQSKRRSGAGVAESPGNGGGDGGQAVRYNHRMTTDRAILRTALELPDKERAELALRLVESLDGEPSNDVEAAWAAEVKHRVDAFRRGEARTRPAVDVFREARERLAHRG